MQFDIDGDRTMISSLRRRGMRGPWLQLLSAVLDLAGGNAEFLRHSEKSWVSATFSGTRHTIALSFTGLDAVAAGETFIAALPDHDFTIPRQLVADAAILSVDHVAVPQPQMTVEGVTPNCCCWKTPEIVDRDGSEASVRDHSLAESALISTLRIWSFSE